MAIEHIRDEPNIPNYCPIYGVLLYCPQERSMPPCRLQRRDDIRSCNLSKWTPHHSCTLCRLPPHHSRMCTRLPMGPTTKRSHIGVRAWVVTNLSWVELDNDVLCRACSSVYQVLETSGFIISGPDPVHYSDLLTRLA